MDSIVQNYADLYSDDLVIANTEVVVSKENVCSNLNVVAAAEDDVDNAKLHFECENSTGDLDGIKDKYYQVKGNNKDDEANVGYDGVPDGNDDYGVFYDRTDGANPPSLPTIC